MRNGILNVEILDFNEAISVINQGFMTVAEEFGLTKDNCPTNGAFIGVDRLLEDYKKGNLMFGYYEADNMVGFAQISHMQGNQYTLEKITVLPSHRHRGIGMRLMEHGTSLVQQLGGTDILIGIIDDNKRLKDWYEAYGFVSLETREFAHLPFTVCFMKLDVANKR